MAEVARRVPVRYETLLRRRKEPGFPPDHNITGPERYDVLLIRSYLHSKKAAHNAGDLGQRPPVYKLNEREQAYADRANAAAAREKFKLEVEMAEYIPRLDANRQVETAHSVVRRELRKAMEFELPPRLEMLRAGEIRKILVAKLDDIVKHMPHKIMGSNGYKTTNGNGS